MKRVAVAAVGMMLILFLLPVLLVDDPAGAAEEDAPLILPAVPAPAKTAEKPPAGGGCGHFGAGGHGRTAKWRR